MQSVFVSQAARLPLSEDLMNPIQIRRHPSERKPAETGKNQGRETFVRDATKSAIDMKVSTDPKTRRVDMF